MAWLVFGGGVSGLAAVKLLLSRGQAVILFDQKPIEPATKDRLRRLGAEVVIGQDISGLDLDKISNCVLSPGIASSDPLVVRLVARGVEIISEIDLALDGYQGKVIAVTGTNGKSTSVSMIHHVLNHGQVANSLAGNIGIPPSTLVLNPGLRDIVVLELSSYQLEQSHNLPCSFAAITSFSPDHLGRHGDLRSYFLAKWKIIDAASENCLLMLSPAAYQYAKELKLSTRGLEIELIDEQACQRYGITEESTAISLKHNLLNGLVAVRAGMHVGHLSNQTCLNALKSFQGLEHRFEYVGTAEGRRIFNDSKATNVASTIVALESLKHPVVLWLGGQGKGESFEPIADFHKSISGIVAFGASRGDIARDLRKHLPLLSYPTLKEALAGFDQILAFQPGDIVFSPACASFDEFKNFEDRGRFFKNQIKSLLLK